MKKLKRRKGECVEREGKGEEREGEREWGKRKEVGRLKESGKKRCGGLCDGGERGMAIG